MPQSLVVLKQQWFERTATEILDSTSNNMPSVLRRMTIFVQRSFQHRIYTTRLNWEGRFFDHPFMCVSLRSCIAFNTANIAKQLVGYLLATQTWHPTHLFAYAARTPVSLQHFNYYDIANGAVSPFRASIIWVVRWRQTTGSLHLLTVTHLVVERICSVVLWRWLR